MIDYSIKGCYFLLWIIYMIVRLPIVTIYRIAKYIIKEDERS